MCVNKRWITNKYTGHRFLVSCGHCKSCLQEKAVKNANRIRREFDGKRIALFVTLTYDRISCPYVREEDLLSHKTILPIYRDYTVHRSARTGKYKRKFGAVELDNVVIPPEDSNYFVGSYKWLKHQPHKIGVPYFKDFQNFVKRLRINCSRSLIDHEGFSIFDCSEYGSRTKRPHFHFLLFISPNDDTFYRNAILKAWPFASQRRTEKYIELARDPSSYVASYVNCRNSISAFFAKYFKPKHTFSRYFGTNDPQFSLASLLSKVSSGSLTYSVRTNKQGIPENSNFLVPFYVINRFFPIFKGSSRMSCDEIRYHLLTTGEYLPSSDYERPSFSPRYEKPLDYSKGYLFVDRSGDHVIIKRFIPNDSDLHKISQRLKNAASYFINHGFGNIYDYAFAYESVWRSYKSTLLRMHWESSDESLFERYDNLSDVEFGRVRNDFLESYLSDNCVPLDPNEFPSNKSSTANMSGWFDLYDKERKVSNEIMSRNGHYV